MLLPPGCFASETRIEELEQQGSDVAAAEALGLEIPPQLVRAVPKRRLEFLAGRLCARRALRQAGYADEATIAIGEQRAPVWPPGFVGSIAHGNGTAWAVVAAHERYRGLGIDLEEIVAPASARSLSTNVLRPEERERMQPAGLSEEQFVSLVFSAKESLFKCLHPITLARFGFQDAEVVHLDLGASLLRLSLRAALSAEFQPGTEFDMAFELSSQIRTAVFMQR
jgi:enterobactin synthetase component D